MSTQGSPDVPQVQHVEYDDEGNVIPETWPTEPTDVPANTVRKQGVDP